MTSRLFTKTSWTWRITSCLARGWKLLTMWCLELSHTGSTPSKPIRYLGMRGSRRCSSQPLLYHRGPTRIDLDSCYNSLRRPHTKIKASMNQWQLTNLMRSIKGNNLRLTFWSSSGSKEELKMIWCGSKERLKKAWFKSKMILWGSTFRRFMIAL